MSVLVYLGLGSNVGDRQAYLQAALTALPPAVRVLRTSSVYETEPWGYAEQGKFLNLVVEAETELPPVELLRHVKAVEQQVGRRPSFRNGPREIDVDILLYGAEQYADSELQIPHPRLVERAFALAPLADLAPSLQVPGAGRSVADLLAAVDGGGVRRLASRRQRLLFWLLLSAASVFFAEVVSGASPFAFFTGWGLFVVLPLYGLHTLVLAALAFRNGSPRFSTLFFAGMLFGLYEAYITKVLWFPPWFETIKPFGIDLVAFLLLVPYWHTFMSFIIPLLVVETLANSSSTIFANLPPRAQGWLSSPRFLYGTAIWFGLLQTAGATQPGQAFLSAIMNLAVVFVLLRLWGRAAGRRFELAELLPRRRSFTVMAVLLALMYFAMGLFLLPEKLPSAGPQAAILAIYTLVIWAFRRSLSRPGQQTAALPALFTRPSVRGLAAAYLLAALLAGFLSQDLRNIFFLVNTVLGCLFGLVALVYCLRQLRRA